MAGRFLAHLVHVELTLDGIIFVHFAGRTPSPDSSQRIAPLMQALNLTRKISAVGEVVKSTPDAEQFSDLAERLRKIAGYRNKFAHRLFSRTGERYVFADYYKGTDLPVTLEEHRAQEREAIAVHTACVRLYEHLLRLAQD
jgi:hypothetical protein